jgi:hypothetical protein
VNLERFIRATVATPERRGVSGTSALCQRIVISILDKLNINFDARGYGGCSPIQSYLPN